MTNEHAIPHRQRCIESGELLPAMVWRTNIDYADGGPDPLDVEVFADRRGFLVYVGLGLTERGPKISDDPSISGFGFELTLRLRCDEVERVAQTAKDSTDLMELVPFWPVGVLNSLARYVFKSKRPFVHADYMHMTNTPWRANFLGFADDLQLGSEQTDNGAFTFRSVFPLADAAAMKQLADDGESFLQRAKAADPWLLWQPEHAPPAVPTSDPPKRKPWWRRLVDR